MQLERRFNYENDILRAREEIIGHLAWVANPLHSVRLNITIHEIHSTNRKSILNGNGIQLMLFFAFSASSC